MRYAWLLTAFLLLGTGAHAETKLEKSSLTIGLLPSAEFLPVYLAMDQGFFAEQGLKVTGANFQAGIEVAQAVVGGALDIGAGGGTDALTAIAAERPIKAIWQINSFVTHALIGKSGVKSWDDLRGKNIAVSSPGAQTDLVVRWLALKQGLDPDTDIKIVAAGSPFSRWATIKNGTAAAALLTEPQASDAVSSGLPLITRLSTYVPAWPSEVFLTSADFLKKNPETLKAFFRAMNKADLFLLGHEKESVDVYMKDMKLSEPDAKIAYNLMRNTYPADGAFSMEGWDFTQDLMLRSKAISEKLAYDKVFDRTYVDWVKNGMK